MMTREEVIEIFEQKGWWIAQKETLTSKQAEEIIKLNDAVNFALSALRPVSREQVEKVFHGCEMCREEKKVKSDNFCGAATMRIVGDSIDLRGDEKKIKFFGHIYAPSFSVKFCPFCGKPLTDEARQYIEDDLDGIGYLYPCLLTYKSPNTERIHVVRFYYDIIQKWFVNNGEELCEKDRCIAWMPLPAPYDRRPPEGEA